MRNLLLYLFASLLILSTSSCSKDDAVNAAIETGEFTLTSEAVVNGELLEAFKCEERVNGIEKSIPLAWSGVPEGTVSLAVSMIHYPFPDDTSVLNSYLTLWDIDPSVTSIAHGAADDGDWFIGANKDGKAISYTSPCSTSPGSHEYTITLYALSQTPASLPTANSIDINHTALISALESVTILGTAKLTFNDVHK